MSAPYLGDYADDETVHFMWSSNDSNGASITRSTDGEVRVYRDNGVTQTTTGVTDTENFDSLTGVHVCTIATTDSFYETAADFTVCLQGATIDTRTVNAVLAHFSIENRFMRGTNSAALASVVGALDDTAAADDPTSADTVMQYVKQLVNLLAGSAGIGTMPAAQAPANAINLFEMVRSIYDDSNELQGDWVDAGRLDTILDAVATPAQVNTEVLDVMNTDTLNELAQGAPAATPTHRAAMMLLYMALRDKLDVTSSFKEVHNDAGTVICKKALTDDGTTYSEAEMETGP